MTPKSVRPDSVHTSASSFPEGPLRPADENAPLLTSKLAHARPGFIDENAGLLLVAASQLFISAMNLLVKVLKSLDDPVPTLEVILVQMVITYVCSVAYMFWKEIPNPLLGPKGVRTLLVSRGLTGFLGISGIYFALQYLSLSDAIVLTFLAPILTGFSGAVFLKEPLYLKEVLAGLCSFAGVILIARPQFLFGSPQIVSDPSEVTPAQRMLSVAVALIGVVGTTGTYTIICGIGKRAHVFHLLASFSSQCVLVSTLGIILFKLPLVLPSRTGTSWLAMLFLIGIFGLVGQVLLTMGLQRETAGRGALATYSSIVFAVVLEYIVFHTIPSTLSAIGSLIIVGSAVSITLTRRPVSQLDRASNQPDGDPEA